ncbi:transglutaminase domain-containing protein [Winogradskyella sp. R77965]|uniref:transglutaminase domain-containing protein n=1 Tax=Winogradskyella sp. R77965 TaxID=3093872 RepID=UPI0037DC2443
MTIFKKIIWILKRHPFLYITRFRLLSRNVNVSDINGYSYNVLNKKNDIAQYFYDVNKEIFKDGRPENDSVLVKKICVWLDANIKGGPGLSESSDRALKMMLAGDGGVCSDIAQVFNNFCVINDVLVREWGTTAAPFNRNYGGHSFNEVYCSDLSKWVLFDVARSFIFCDEKSTPLSVVELFKLKQLKKPINYKSFVFDKKIEEKSITKNYLNPDIIPFLICDYRNTTYDKFLKFARPYLPVFVIHFFIFSIHQSYHYQFPLNNYKEIFSA